MATIRFVNGSERKLLTTEERAKTDPGLAAKLKTHPELAGAVFVHHSGSSKEPELFEVQLPPERHVEPHAHTADEIIVVTQGEAHFGRQVYGTGSSIFIPKMTLYAFRSGPQGLTYLNFRPTKSPGAIFKDEYMAIRAADLEGDRVDEGSGAREPGEAK